MKSKWGPWITNQLKEQKSNLLLNVYPWADLGVKPQEFTVTSDGTYKRWMLKYSVSGCEDPDSIKVFLDGKQLPWETAGIVDRRFYIVKSDTGLSKGKHTLRFEQGSQPKTLPRQLCNINWKECKKKQYIFLTFLVMDDDEYLWDDSAINAYPVYLRSTTGKPAGYKPNHERCLMRNMTSEYFCKICYENLWHKMFAKVNAIDDIQVTQYNATYTKIKVQMVKIGQFREGGPKGDEVFKSSWILNGKPLNQFNDIFELILPTSAAKGNWQFNAKYVTSEVRSDPKKLLEFSKKFTIK